MSLGTATGVNGERSRNAVQRLLNLAQQSRENARTCQESLDKLVPAREYSRERRPLQSALREYTAEATAYQHAASETAAILGVEVKPWTE